jgi:plastocyanin
MLIARGRLAVLGTTIALLALGAGLAAAAAETIGVRALCCDYSKDSYSSDRGSVPLFDNAGAGVSHNVAARDRGPDGRPLFRSATFGPGGSGPVSGVQYLGSGTYDFFCTIHPFEMRASLVVGAAGTPVARPRIDVTIPAQPLRAVRRTGKLTARLRAATRSDNVTLIARRGARRIASKRNIDLAPGARRTVRLSLTRAGRRAMAGGSRAAVSVTGTVAFGRPDRASRVLR